MKSAPQRNIPLLLLLFAVSACKAKLDQVELIAPPGTVVEYRLEPAGPSGSLTLSAKETIRIGAEAERLSLTVRHPDKQALRSPDLRVMISPKIESAREGFAPGTIETRLRLKSRDHEPNGFGSADCRNLVAARGAQGSITVEIAPPSSPGDCQDKELREHDPRWSGRGRQVWTEEGFHLVPENYFSLADDTRMGQDFVRKFSEKNSAHVIDQGPAVDYLQGLMNRIAAVSDAPQIKPRVHLINANVLNAFALPGGEVYVFRGIMEKVRDEHELVGILGHEWAHVTARHGTRNMTRSINLQLAALTTALTVELATKKTVDERKNAKLQLIKKAATAAAFGTTQLLLMAGSREAEEEADKLGAQYAYRAGYAPDGIGRFFDAMAGQKSDSRTWVEDLTSSHPNHRLRVEHNRSDIAAFFPEDASALPSNTLAFRDVIGDMKAHLPPMLDGKPANDMLALQFVETNQEVAHGEISRFFSKMED